MATVQPTGATSERSVTRAQRIARMVAENVHDRAHDEEQAPTPGNISRGGESHPQNYQTWAIDLWLSNEPGSDQMARGIVEDAITAAAARLIADERAPVCPMRDAGDQLKMWAEDAAPELTGMYADLLSAALQEADWPRIARSFAPEEEEIAERVAADVEAILLDQGQEMSDANSHAGEDRP